MAYQVRGPLTEAGLAWSLVGDTDHLNRQAKNPPLEQTIQPDEHGYPVLTGVVVGPGPIRHRFEEVELLWVHQQRFRQVRALSGPLLRRSVYEAVLHAEDDGVRPTISVEMETAHGWMAPIVKALTSRGLQRWGALLEALPGGSHADNRQDQRTMPKAVQSALERWRASGAHHDVLQRLSAYFLHARDRELREIDAFALADAWGLPRREVLRSFLKATAVGVLELYWSVRCPRCSAGVSLLESLSNLADHASCSSCRIGFEPDLERTVQVLFAAPPALRPPHGEQFCTLFPAGRQDVLALMILQPGQEETFTLTLAEGTCMIGVGGDTPDRIITVAPGGQREWTWTPDADAVTLATGPVTFTLRNPGSHRVRVDLSHTRSASGVSAAYLATMPEYRSRFGPQVLAADVRIGVQAIAILFTDLTGSAALYHEHGDATAFRFVHEHFGILEASLEAHGGVRVKTIGDALMAAFHTPLQAVQAARQMQQDFAVWVESWAMTQPPGLKVGIHFGPAMAVHSDQAGLDYFGGTVNLAARAEGKASRGLVIWTEAVQSDPAVAQYITEEAAHIRPFQTDVKGLPEPMTLYRHAVDAPPSGAAS